MTMSKQYAMLLVQVAVVGILAGLLIGAFG